MGKNCLCQTSCCTHSLIDFNFGWQIKKGGQENTDLMCLCVYTKVCSIFYVFMGKTQSVLYFFREEPSGRCNLFFESIDYRQPRSRPFHEGERNQTKQKRKFISSRWFVPLPPTSSLFLLALFLMQHKAPLRRSHTYVYVCMCRLQSAKWLFRSEREFQRTIPNKKVTKRFLPFW